MLGLAVLEPRFAKSVGLTSILLPSYLLICSEMSLISLAASGSFLEEEVSIVGSVTLKQEIWVMK